MNNCMRCEKPVNDTNAKELKTLTRSWWWCFDCDYSSYIEKQRAALEEEKQMDIELAWEIREKERKEEAEKLARDYMAGVY